MLKRLRVCFPFVGDTVGGSHISTLLMIEGLAELGVVPIVVIHGKGILQTELQRRSIEYIFAPEGCLIGSKDFFKQPFKTLKIGLSLKKFLKKHHIDIVHTNDGRMHKTWGIAARLAKAKFVLHKRGISHSHALAFFSFLSHTPLTISSYCRSSFPKQMALRTKVVDNPFETNKPLPDKASAKLALCQKLNVSNRAKIVGFVGNFTNQKRPLFFVEIAALISKRLGQECFFPIFGDPRLEMRSSVERRINELDMEGKCVLMGPRFPIEPYIAGFDILLAPAVREGFGRTLVEAMLVKTPVVAADHGGHKEIIEHDRNGLLVQPDCAEVFSNAIVELLSNPNRMHKISSQAYTMALKRFSVQKHAIMINEIYEQILS